MRSLGLQQKSYPQRYICLFSSVRKCQVSNVNFLQKQHIWEKSSFWVMFQKPQDQSERRILKLEYLTNRLRWEFEFLDRARGPWKQQILVACRKWEWSVMYGLAQSYFFACVRESIEIKILFNHFKWVWSGVLTVIQNNKLEWT